MSWAKHWPIGDLVVLSTKEELEREGRSEPDENSRHHGLVYCDMCGCWFQSGCLCDDFRREDA